MALVEIISSVLITIAIVFGNIAGVGGAGMIVPVLLLGFSLEILQASALSNFLICVGFILRFYFNYYDRHPTKNKPVIDYDTASLMLPASLLGTKFGVIVHDIFPRSVLFILLTVTLLYLAYSSYVSGKKLSEAEDRETKEEKASQMVALTYVAGDDFNSSANLLDSNKTRIREIEEEEARRIPPKKTVLMLVLFLLMMVSIAIEGSQSLPSLVGIKLCSSGYWASFFAYIVICALMVYINARDINALAMEKRLLGLKLTEDDVDWTWPKIMEYSMYGLVAGILSAIFGIGGGMILSSVLVQLGMLPEVVTATCGLFVLFTTGAAFAVLWYEGYWIASYGVALGIVSVLSSILSVWVFNGIIKKLGKPSILVYIMSGVILVSGVVLGFVGFYQDYVEYGTLLSKEAWSFHSYCSPR